MPPRKLWLVFSVTAFKIDQNKKQNRSIDKFQNLGNERKYICKEPQQISGQREYFVYEISEEISHFFNPYDSSLGRHVNAASRKSLEIHANSITKPRTLLKRKFV